MTEFADHHRNRLTFPTKWIMVVEDNIGMQAMLLRLIEKRYGAEEKVMATAVSSARHAKVLLEDETLRERLLCILLDHDTQWGTGPDLLRYMAEKEIHIPVCGISGIPSNNQRLEALGAVDSYVKLDFKGILSFLGVYA